MIEMTMNARGLAAILGTSGVLLGAFGAHALGDRLSAGGLEWWRTAVLYHLVHTAASLGSGGGDGRATASTWSFAVGVALFSGSLYAMALGAPRWFGAVTPFGGVAFIAGWLLLFRGSSGSPRPTA